jgi:hypothetical protein
MYDRRPRATSKSDDAVDCSVLLPGSRGAGGPTRAARRRASSPRHSKPWATTRRTGCPANSPFAYGSPIIGTHTSPTPSYRPGSAPWRRAEGRRRPRTTSQMDVPFVSVISRWPTSSAAARSSCGLRRKSSAPTSSPHKRTSATSPRSRSAPTTSNPSQREANTPGRTRPPSGCSAARARIPARATDSRGPTGARSSAPWSLGFDRGGTPDRSGLVGFQTQSSLQRSGSASTRCHHRGAGRMTPKNSEVDRGDALCSASAESSDPALTAECTTWPTSSDRRHPRNASVNSSKSSAGGRP